MAEEDDYVGLRAKMRQMFDYDGQGIKRVYTQPSVGFKRYGDTEDGDALVSVLDERPGLCPRHAATILEDQVRGQNRHSRQCCDTFQVGDPIGKNLRVPYRDCRDASSTP